MKKKSPKNRNPFATHAKKRKAGIIKSKKDARKSGKNKQREILAEKE